MSNQGTRRTGGVLLLTLIFAIAVATPAAALPWYEEAKLTASDAGWRDEFGRSVGLSGNTAIVGAYKDDDGGTDSGSAYIYQLSGGVWAELAKFSASDAAADDWFGYSVSVDGSTAIAGAHYNDSAGTDSGSAYVFQDSGSGWSEAAKLTASDGAAYDYFGRSVALSGNTAIVGAYQDDDAGMHSGSAYIFQDGGSGWTQVAKLVASDGASMDRFGLSVAVSGGMAIVGAPADDDGGAGSGSAYIFQDSGSGWAQVAKLTASDALAGDSFGIAVALDGNTAVVGAHAADTVGSESGSAYVFQHNGSGWVQVAKLIGSDTAASDYFGGSVALSGETAIVGAVADDDAGSASGSAYLFQLTGGLWTEVDKLTASDAAASDYFGRSVALSNGTAIVGAEGNDNGWSGSDSGSAYVFAYQPPDPHWEGATGNWTEGTKWDPDGVPASDAHAYIDAATGSAYTVTLNSSVAVGALTIDSPDATLDHTSGTLQASTIDILDGTYRLHGGTIQGATVTQTGAKLRYQGTANTLSGVHVEDGIWLDVYGYSAVTLRNGSTFAGDAHVTADTAKLTIDQTCTFDHGGSINLESGWLNVAAGRTLTLGPSMTVDCQGPWTSYLEGATLVNEGLVTCDSGSLWAGVRDFENRGIVEAVNGGAVSVRSSILGNLVGDKLTGGSWRAYAGSTLDFLSGSFSTNAAELVLDGAGSTMRVGNTSTTLESVLSTNAPGGALRILGGRNYTASAPGSFTNQGEVELGGGTFNAPTLTNTATGEIFGYGSIGVPIQNSGLVRAAGGTLTVDLGVAGSSGAVRIDAGATLAATSNVTVEGIVWNSGEVAGPAADGDWLTFPNRVGGPGNYTGNVQMGGPFSPGASPGLVTFEDMMLLDTATLTMEIAGLIPGDPVDGYDVLQGSGILTLDGTLDVDFINGFVPTAGTSFQIFDVPDGNIVGTFGAMSLPSEVRWDVSQLHTEGLLSVITSGPIDPAIPEPATVALFALGLAAIARRRRKR